MVSPARATCWRRPLAAGWERDVADELLRQDIAAAIDGNPDRRLASARELAQRLRTLESRRTALLQQRNLIRSLVATPRAAASGGFRQRRECIQVCPFGLAPRRFDLAQALAG